MAHNESITLDEFVKKYRITMVCQPTGTNPCFEGVQVGGRRIDFDHWRVVLRRGDHQMTVYFSMGPGYAGKPPEIAMVLDALASDVATYENTKDFNEWLYEYGYEEEDEKKATKTYRNIVRQAKSLLRLLGEEGYENLLWNTETL